MNREKESYIANRSDAVAAIPTENRNEGIVRVGSEIALDAKGETHSLTRWIKPLPIYVASFTVGLFLNALSLLIQLIGDRNTALKLSPLSNVLLAICFFVIPLLVESHWRWREEKRYYDSVREYADKIKRLLNNIHPQLSEYVQMSVRSSIVSMEDLSAGKSIERAYAEQIAIADSLAKGAQTRFWATSTDKPSKFWEQGVSYFLTLESLNIPATGQSGNSPPPKARLVMLRWDDLLEDYTKSRDSFESFIRWHKQFGFELKFYVFKSHEELEDIIGRSIVNDSDPLKDFMVKDDEFVYGRTRLLVGNRTELKFIPHETRTNLDTFNSYLTLFTSLWRLSLTAEKVIERLDLARAKDLLEAQTRKDYRDDFRDASEGERFFAEVCKKIGEARNSLLAVDIADRKDGISCWSFKEEYQGFLDASINAAREGAGAKRIFVVKTLLPLMDIHLRQVLKEQLQAGIEIIIINDETITNSGLDVDDFILADDGFGFRLGDEEFTKFNLEVGKNLIPKVLLDDFKGIFDNLYNQNEKRIFSGSTDIPKLEQFFKELSGTQSPRALPPRSTP